MGLEQFARYQPFTPVTEALRGLLTGTPIGGVNAIAAVAWSLGIAGARLLGKVLGELTRRLGKPLIRPNSGPESAEIAPRRSPESG
jgi:hypothetical protein